MGVRAVLGVRAGPGVPTQPPGKGRLVLASARRSRKEPQHQGLAGCLGVPLSLPSPGCGDTHHASSPRPWGAGNKQPRESRPGSQGSGLKTPGPPALLSRAWWPRAVAWGQGVQSSSGETRTVLGTGTLSEAGRGQRPLAPRPSARPESRCPCPAVGGASAHHARRRPAHAHPALPGCLTPATKPPPPAPCPCLLSRPSRQTATQTRDGPTFHSPEPKAVAGPPPPLLSPRPSP